MTEKFPVVESRLVCQFDLEKRIYAKKLCRKPAAMTKRRRKNTAVSLIIFFNTMSMVPKNRKKSRYSNCRQSKSAGLSRGKEQRNGARQARIS